MLFSTTDSNSPTKMAKSKASKDNADEIEMQGHARRDLERETSQSYRIEQVVADLVDNCIDAQAKHVEVIFNEEKYDKRNSHYLIVLDDGGGIEANQISSIMDFGAERNYDELDLGKFGVGLKSSSLSQAKEVTVLSKVKGGKLALRRLSHEIVYKRDKWVLIEELGSKMKTDAIKLANKLMASRQSGTAVVLEDMHKIDLQVGHDSSKREYLNSEYGIIREYLSLVFECYLDGITLNREDGATIERKVEISFNGKKNLLKPLDPFCRDQKDGTNTGTLSLVKDISITIDGKVFRIPVTIWITPKADNREPGYDDRLTTACRDLGIMELQGIFFYRNGRLIDFPGWKKVKKLEEHMTCLRWEVKFPPSFDHFFQLDPSKREVQVPMVFLEELKDLDRLRFKWHADDEKCNINHRSRARMRGSGKDEVLKTINPTVPLGINKKQGEFIESFPTTTVEEAKSKSNYLPSSKARSSSAQALKKIRITEKHGSKTGDLMIAERQEEDTWVVTLNNNHAMYNEFVKRIGSRK
jgi:hypothetical protein